MGQGDYGPDGAMLPGRPRPHYTYSRKSSLKKNKGPQFGLDFTDNEDDDSNLQAVSSWCLWWWCFWGWLQSPADKTTQLNTKLREDLWLLLTLLMFIADDLELWACQRQQTSLRSECEKQPIIYAGLKTDYYLSVTVAYLTQHNVNLIFCLSSVESLGFRTAERTVGQSPSHQLPQQLWTSKFRSFLSEMFHSSVVDSRTSNTQLADGVHVLAARCWIALNLTDHESSRHPVYFLPQIRFWHLFRSRMRPLPCCSLACGSVWWIQAWFQLCLTRFFLFFS